MFVSAQGSSPPSVIAAVALVSSPPAPGTPAQRMLGGMSERKSAREQSETVSEREQSETVSERESAREKEREREKQRRRERERERLCV